MKSLVPLDDRQLSKFYARKLPKYFTADEVHEILSANVHDPKAYLLVNALWKTGARISELLQLHATDLDPAGRSIRLTTLKAGIKHKVYAGTGRPAKGKKSERPAERILIIPDDLMVDLVSVAISENTRIFPYSRATAYRIVLKACTQAGINDERRNVWDRREEQEHDYSGFSRMRRRVGRAKPCLQASRRDRVEERLC